MFRYDFQKKLKSLCFEIFVFKLKIFDQYFPGSRSETYVATIATQNGYIANIYTEEFFCNFAQPKKDMLRLYATQKGMLRLLRLKMDMLRLCTTKVICATQNRYAAVLRDIKKVCCDHCDPNWVCCHFAQPKSLRIFTRPKKHFDILTTFDQRNTFRLSSIGENNFNREKRF